VNQSFIEHNKLDDMFYHDLYQESFILHRYSKQGVLLFDEFDGLMQDSFYLLYKMALRFNPPITMHLNYELLFHLKKSGRIGKLRGRTKGSKTSTYIALKFILDGLLDHARGKLDLRALQDQIEIINQEYEALSSDLYKDLLENKVSLKDLLTFDEVNMLENIYTSDQNNAFVEALLKKTFSQPNVGDKIQELNPTQTDSDKIENQIDQCFSQPQTSGKDPIKELIEKVSQVDQEPDSDADASDPLNNDIAEQEVIEDSTSEDWQSKLKNEFEERYLPYLKNQYLTLTSRKPEEGQYKTPLDQDSPVDQKIIQDSTELSQNIQAETVEEIKIDSDTENALRAGGSTPSFGGEEQLKLKKQESILDRLKKLSSSETNLINHIQSIDFESIIDKSTQAIDDFNATTETLGMDKTSLNMLGFDEIIAMQQRFKKPKFIQFINKIGRTKLYAQKLQYKKRRESSIPVERVTSSHHIDWMLDDEYIGLALDIEAFENDFYDRFLQDQLLTFELVAEKDRRKGPIILCYDGSGSMEGVKIEETKAHILSIMEIARIQKRRLVLIQFASKTEPMYIKEINPLSVGAKDILDVLDTFICGGTDFEKPLAKAAEYIAADPKGQSDVLFITDGQCEISKTFMDSFSSLKKARKFKLYTIIMHSHTYQDYGDIGKISDEILDIRRNDIGNWNEETNRKLYTLI